MENPVSTKEGAMKEMLKKIRHIIIQGKAKKCIQTPETSKVSQTSDVQFKYLFSFSMHP